VKTEQYIRRLKQFTEEVSVYPVSCEKLCNVSSDRLWLEAVLSGGARIVQLRDKESNDAALLEKAKFFRRKTKEAGALFMVNDRLDIALLSDADGMHVGRKDLPVGEIRGIGPDLLIGLSCNNEEHVRILGEQVQRGENVVSYFNFGPLYETETKQGLHTFLGPATIKNLSSLCPLPFTVMGGIKLSHINELVLAGARRIAVVTAISQAEDMEAETARWIESIKAAEKS